MYIKFKIMSLASGDGGQMLATSRYFLGRSWLGGFQGAGVYASQ